LCYNRFAADTRHAEEANDANVRRFYEYLAAESRTHFSLLMLNDESLSSQGGWVGQRHEKEAVMKWFKALAEDELPEGARQVVRVGEQSVLLVRHEGQIYAIASACPHMGQSLKGAKIEGDTITCPRHHSAFDLRTGDVKQWSPWPPAVGRMLGALSRESASRLPHQGRGGCHLDRH
jgi:nitrite reductase/ring-hydroxylating ferredoxin subunit